MRAGRNGRLRTLRNRPQRTGRAVTGLISFRLEFVSSIKGDSPIWDMRFHGSQFTRPTPSA